MASLAPRSAVQCSVVDVDGGRDWGAKYRAMTGMMCTCTPGNEWTARSGSAKEGMGPYAALGIDVWKCVGKTNRDHCSGVSCGTKEVHLEV